MNMGNNSNRSVLVSKEFGIKIKDELALFDTRVWPSPTRQPKMGIVEHDRYVQYQRDSFQPKTFKLHMISNHCYSSMPALRISMVMIEMQVLVSIKPNTLGEEKWKKIEQLEPKESRGKRAKRRKRKKRKGKLKKMHILHALGVRTKLAETRLTRIPHYYKRGF